jgi:cytochrome c oxidase assembly protein subunit 15
MLFRRLTLAALLICLVLIPLGAYVRLSHAGLGCPDWPGCYGHIGVPMADHHIEAANAAYPERPVEVAKGWKEMIHRYIATALGLVIIALVVVGWRGRKQGLPWKLPLAMLGWVLVQGALGAFTVTWKVMPLIVTAHLMGGMVMIALTWMLWLRVREAEKPVLPTPPSFKPLAALAVALLAAQIFLGGWTSTNYAALACPEFPACAQGELWPQEPNYREAFRLWHPQGQYETYEFGVLDTPTRQTIHAVHRLGAVIVGTALIVLGFFFAANGGSARWKGLGYSLVGMTVLQIVIGISTVHFGLPLAVATAHNAGAMLLLLVTLSIAFHAWRGRPVS